MINCYYTIINDEGIFKKGMMYLNKKLYQISYGYFWIAGISFDKAGLLRELCQNNYHRKVNPHNHRR